MFDFYLNRTNVILSAMPHIGISSPSTCIACSQSHSRTAMLAVVCLKCVVDCMYVTNVICVSVD